MSNKIRLLVILAFVIVLVGCAVERNNDNALSISKNALSSSSDNKNQVKNEVLKSTENEKQQNDPILKKETSNNQVLDKEKSSVEQQEIIIDKCESSAPFSAKIYCYGLEAISKIEPEICYKLEKDLAIKTCLSFFISKADSSFEKVKHLDYLGICNKLSDEDKNNCFWEIGYKGLDENGCFNLPENKVKIVEMHKGGGREVTKMECLILFNGNVKENRLKIMNVSFCYIFEGKSQHEFVGCMDKFANVLDDINLCKSIGCVFQFAKSNKNPLDCERVRVWGNLEEQIAECKDSIAIEKLDPDGCETQNCIRRIAIELRKISICFNGGGKSCYEILIGGSNLTINDCDKMKEKCSDCSVGLYDDCLLSAFISSPNLKEEDCELISDNSIKKKCIFNYYDR